ncbi:MAG: hypothetical protein ACREH5_01355 [Candidatus Omnitrophota bacterium]
MNFFKSNFILKIAALLCAAATYFYVHQEIAESEKKIQDPSYKLIKLTAKKLPVKARLAASPPEGHRIVMDQIAAVPAQIIVIGPEALLEEADTAETALVDVSDNTKTVTKKIPLESVAGIHLAGEPYLVEVTVPIEKTEKAQVA